VANDRAGSNHGAITDADSRQHHGAGPDPDPVTDRDRAVIERGGAAMVVTELMRARQEQDLVSDRHPVSDLDPLVEIPVATHVHIHPLADGQAVD
jgi:hypothetical protein